MADGRYVRPGFGVPKSGCSILRCSVIDGPFVQPVVMSVMARTASRTIALDERCRPQIFQRNSHARHCASPAPAITPSNTTSHISVQSRELRKALRDRVAGNCFSRSPRSVGLPRLVELVLPPTLPLPSTQHQASVW